MATEAKNLPNRPNAPKSTASRHTCHSRAGGNPLRHTQYDIRYTRIDNQTLAHFRHFSSLFTNFPSTTVESALQIAHFMQNKPNFQKAQMNVSRVSTKDYAKWTLGQRGKNKPNSKPIQTQSNPIKANKMPKQTQFKPKQTQFVVSLSNLFQTKSTLCEFFLFLIFLCPSYNLTRKTWWFAAIIPDRSVR